MKINRLFEIIYILLDKQKVSARELAEHFEVSVRMIYRDIDMISEAGIPYKGAKEHYILEIEDRELASAVTLVLEQITPVPKPRKKKGS